MLEIKLNDICLNITDGTHSTVLDCKNGHYRLLSCKNIKNGKIIFNHDDRRIELGTLKSLRKRTKMAMGDVVLTTVGTIGESSIINESFPSYEFQRSVAIIKPNPNLVLSKFLHYYLISLSGKNQIKQLIKGAVQPCLFLNDLIVDIIGTIDNLIDFISKKIQLLEQLGAKLYISKIQENYKIFNVSTLNICYGESIPKNKRKKGVIPLYASNGRIDFIDKGNAKQNTVIFGCRGTLGNIFFCKKECFVLNTSFYITDFKNYGGLYFALKYNNGFSEFSTGAAQPQITINGIKDARIKIPINSNLNYLLDCLSKNEEILIQLKKIKRLLLSKYF